MDGNTPDLNVLGSPAHSTPLYNIQDRSLITDIEGTQFRATAYKLGDKYVAARGHEFGYANYELDAEGE